MSSTSMKITSSSLQYSILSKLKEYPHLTAGSTAGICSTFILHPLDLVKTRFQVNEGMKQKNSAVPSYRTTFNAFRTIATKEGVRALYQGVPTAMLGSGISWGLYFFLYEKAKLQYQTDPGKSEKLPPWKHILCGTQAGVMTVFVTNPIWLIKTRIQLQVSESERARLNLGTSSSPKYRGFLHGVRTIVTNEGPLALYRGLVPALFLTSHGALQFMIYEELKSFTINVNNGELGVMSPLLLGASSKVVASTLTYPYQVVKARIQRLTLKGETPYKGTLDCIQRTFNQEGVLGFYKGLAPNLIRIAPAAGITFWTYEFIKKKLM
jgi:solute carrier family 25 (mitochondrial folate transporter), member 32